METIKIPFRNHVEKLRIMRIERNKGRLVTSNKSHIYSSPKKFEGGASAKGVKTFKNFGCNVCNSTFRITTTGDIQWAICHRCGSPNVDLLIGRPEEAFEQRII